MADAVEASQFEDSRHPGFPVEIFVEQDKIDDFICAICTEVCRDAVETSCTHIFCEGCLQQALEQKRECPLDHTPLKLEAVRVAGFVRRKVLNMRVKCPNFVSGCPAVIVVSELTPHLRTCPHALIVCNRCRERVQARQLEAHRETECPCREVRCEHCFSMVSFDDLKTHYTVHCPDMPVSCPNQCGDGPFPRKLIARHCDEVCPLQELRCRYAPHGCAKRVIRREMEAHLNDAKAHLDLVERHYASELEAIRRETTDMVRFVMQVGSQEAFMKLLAAVSAKSPVEEVELIVRGMRMYESEPTVQERGCFALITLCEAGNKMADSNIAAVVAHRGIDVIVNAMRLHPQAVKVQEYALHVLRKMATNMDVKTFVQKGSIDCIGQILRTMQFHSSVIGIQRDAIGVLLNMAVNDSIESRIGHLGGIEQIIAAMDAFPGSTSLMQLACHALFHLTFDDHNKERLVSANALPRLMEALTRHSQHTNTVYYALRAMAQLAKIDRYRDKMRRLGLIDLARQALATHPGHKDLQKKVKMLLGRLLPTAGGPSPTSAHGDSGPSSPKS